MRKRVHMLTLTILMTVSICFGGMVPAKAAAKKSSTRQWANAYMKIIKV